MIRLFLIALSLAALVGCGDETTKKYFNLPSVIPDRPGCGDDDPKLPPCHDDDDGKPKGD